MSIRTLIHRRRVARNGHSNGSATGILSFFSAFGGSFLIAGIVSVAALGGIGFGTYALVAKDLVPPETMASREIARSTKILDRKGRQLYEIFDPQVGRRTTVPLREMSPYLIQATISTEDSSFYENQGFDLRGIARAAWANVTRQGVLQGGSSITQQLARNVFLPEEERTMISVIRKLKEVIMSIELTRRYSKDEILAFYLNEINYGNLSYGVEAAAQSYFGKSARDLNLGESAMLAGIPNAPALYSPLIDLTRATNRQRTVLDLMVRQDYITQDEADRAKQEKLEFKAAQFEIQAPHFVMYVRDLLEQKYGARALYRSGMRVTTTLDLDLQELGEQIVRDQVAKTGRSINGRNAALVAIDPRTSEILAMVGSADYFNSGIDGQVNIATSERQPGSSFKPFTYATAFMKGWNPATMILDVPITLRDGVNPPYTPLNVDKKFHGPVSVREALSNSMNIPAIKTIEFAGIDTVLDTAHRLGISTLNRKGWYGVSLTLGGGEVKLLDMTYAYATFATGGKMKGVPVLPELQQPGLRTLDPMAILRIEDSNGQVKEQFDNPQERQIITPELAYLITDILADNQARAPIFGNSLRLAGGRPAAVKTGTTEDLHDFWTMGYTPELVVGVWMGNADNKPLTGGFSSTTTGPIWEQFMNAALDGVPVSQFVRPAGITTATVCIPSGLVPGPLCPKTRTEVFISGQVPTEQDNLWKVVRIDKRTGLPAAPNTPPDQIEEKAYLVLPSEAQKWAQENGLEQPPDALVSAGGLPSGATGILTPFNGSTVRGTLSIRIAVDGQGLEQWVVELGKGNAPAQWVQVVPPRKDGFAAGTLADLDAVRMGLGGVYTLRLTVRRTNGASEQHTVTFTVDTSPVVSSPTPAPPPVNPPPVATPTPAPPPAATAAPPTATPRPPTPAPPAPTATPRNNN